VAWRRLHNLLRPWSHESLIYEVTPRCNLRCQHCYNVWKDGEPYPKTELPTDRACRLIRKAVRDSRCRNFTLTGGEPLLRDDLETLVATARAIRTTVTLITNGTLLPEARIQSLIRAGVSMFELPLNSSDRAMHNHMAGDLDCFDKVTRAAACIRFHGAQVAFVFVGTKLNIEHWKGALELGIALGASGFLLNRYNAGGECHGHPETLMPSVDQVRDSLAIAETYARRYGVDIGASIAIPPCLIDPADFPHVGFGFCAAGTDRAYYTIDPMGQVRPCNHSTTILGNLFTQSLKSMVRSKTLAAFKQARPALCQGCSLEDTCLGGCKAAAQVCYNSLTAPDPFLQLNRSLIKRRTTQPSP
jgi:radical SAM protein with 4Fe4S-binding SPASM domain